MNVSRREGTTILAVLLAFLIIGMSHPFQAATTQSVAGSVQVASPPGSHFDNLVFIIMENHNIGSIIPSASYMTSLANSNALATHYSSVVHPSLPNYLAMTGASTFGCAGYDGGPNSNVCTGTAWRSINIVDRLEAGSLSWKAYMEDMTSNCMKSGTGKYAVRHNPFVYYSDIATNPTRCTRVVPAGNGDSALLNDLGSSSTAPNFMWLTPNLCNDMHDCSVAVGNTYLSGLVPKILNSAVFKNNRALLIVTFDEGRLAPPNDYLYTVFAGPTAKANYSSSNHYDHYSFLRTIEDNWGLPTMTSNDASAANMFEFLQAPTPPPPPTFDFQIALQPTAATVQPDNFAVAMVSTTLASGDPQTITLSASCPPVVRCTITPDIGSPGFSSTLNMSSASPGNYTVTVFADGGSVSRTAIYSLNVIASAHLPPVIGSIPPKDVRQLIPIIFTVQANSPDNTPITLSASGLPTGATFDAMTGLFSWTPTQAIMPGVYQVTFTATDTLGASSFTTVQLTVTSLSDQSAAGGTGSPASPSLTKPELPTEIFAIVGISAAALLTGLLLVRRRRAHLPSNKL